MTPVISSEVMKVLICKFLHLSLCMSLVAYTFPSVSCYQILFILVFPLYKRLKLDACAKLCTV
jgi:hypothetical protein